MKIPKSVNINGHNYKVIITTSDKFLSGKHKIGHVEILSSGAMGECEFPTRIIRLNKEIKGDLLYYTFLHEIRHGFQFEMGWPQLLSPQVMEIDCETFVSFAMSLKKQGIV